MAETDAKIILILALLANKIHQNYSRKEKGRRTKSVWVRLWLMERAEKGACSYTFHHLKLKDFEHFSLLFKDEHRVVSTST